MYFFIYGYSYQVQDACFPSLVLCYLLLNSTSINKKSRISNKLVSLRIFLLSNGL